MRENDSIGLNLLHLSLLFDRRNLSNDWQLDVILTWLVLMYYLDLFWLSFDAPYFGFVIELARNEPLFGLLNLSEFLNLVQLRLNLRQELVPFELELLSLGIRLLV